MRMIAGIAGVGIGAALLIAGPAAAACPQFLVAAGYGDICSPSAWMAFEHQGGDRERVRKLKRHHQGADKAGRPKIKFRKSRQARSGASAQ